MQQIENDVKVKRSYFSEVPDPMTKFSDFRGLLLADFNKGL